MNFIGIITVAVLLTLTKAFVAFWGENGKESAKFHNEYRSKHVGTKPLAFSFILAFKAKYCAKRMLMKNLNPADHPCLNENKNEGENIYTQYAGANRGDLLKPAIDAWYGEIKDVHPPINTPGWFMTVNTRLNILHFFQMVWASTTRVGCGGATDGRKTYLVCRYSPRSNILTGRSLRDNVKPLIKPTCKPDAGYCVYIKKTDCYGDGLSAIYKKDCPKLCGTC